MRNKFICKGIMKRMQNEAWLDEINRIVSFHEISDSRYYSAEEHDFWQMRLASCFLLQPQSRFC